MLVEDDNNLREIYGERLLAEGYEIVSASDGEEALALAVKEKPDLIISDVMMPKISGFDMLDILRQTPETKNTQVIMMTALSQAEDKDRADKLGADKYLVKSQVTLEDVARVVHDLIYGPEQPAATPAEPAAPAGSEAAPVMAEPVIAEPTAVVAAPEPTVVAAPVVSEPEPADVVETPEPAMPTDTTETPQSEPVADVTDAQDLASEQADVTAQIEEFIASAVPVETQHTEPLVEPAAEAAEQQAPSDAAAPAPEPVVVVDTPEQPEVQVITPTETPAPAPEQQVTNTEPQPANIPRPLDASEPEPASVRKKVIAPISDPAEQPNINALYEKEMAEEAANTAVANPTVGGVVAAAGSEAAPTPPSPLEQLDPSTIPGVTTEQPEIAADIIKQATPLATPPEGAPSDIAGVTTTDDPEDRPSGAPDPNNPASFAL